MAHVQNLIGGRAVPALSGETAPNLCPADGVVLGSAPRSGRADAEAAVAAARAAFPAWADTPAPTRGDLLLKLARGLEARAEEIARALSLEEGKVIAEARGEVQKALRYVVFAAGDGRRLAGITVPSELRGTFAFTMWRPHGVVGLITPWNFPICIPLWKLAPALVAGNTVVLKPAPETPWTAALIGELVQEAGFPAGVVNVVHGDAEPAVALIEHPAVHAISFTGSTEVGRAIEASCGRLHKPVQCELGGKNPIIVLDDGDVEQAAIACAQGAFGSTGQRCTATSRAIVDHRVADAFVARVTALARAMVPGHPLDEKTSMGPSVSERQMEKVLSFHAVARDGGATITTGGARALDGGLDRGFFPLPTLYDHVAPDARVACEEIFGPVLSVIRVGDSEEALHAANAVPFGLTSSVYTRDIGRAFRFIERLETGMTQVNAPTMGGEGHLPFGGIKATGVGPREMGPDAWKFYAECKTVYINHGGGARTSKFY
jgi:aldehyde dehydrogenase (NAD+)